MNFEFRDYADDYRDYLHNKVVDCLCKHVLHEGETSSKVLHESEAIGYETCKWGYWLGVPEEENRICQLFTIRKMLYDGYNRPVRIVIGKDGTLWVDNLHSAIMYLYVYGLNSRLSDIPTYIIDLRNPVPIVVSTYKGSVRDSVSCISGAIWSARRRYVMYNSKIVNLHYTIGEFITENNLYLDELQPLVSAYKEALRIQQVRK